MRAVTAALSFTGLVFGIATTAENPPAAAAAAPEAGSMTRPPSMKSRASGDMGLGLTAGEEIEHRHPDRHAVLNLIEDHRARPVGDLGRELHPAIDGSRVHHHASR